jgi:membrane associated rhomboid family serine protease
MNDKAKVPWLSLVLIGLNMLAAFALFFNSELAFEFGFRPNVPKFSAFVVSPFLHLNLIHLLGNMVFLAGVGPVVEFAAGRWRFFAIYFMGAFAGIGGHMLMVSVLDRDRPLIGASAAIAACIGYTVVRYMNVKVPVMPRLKLPIWALAGLWVLLQAVGGIVHLGDEGGGTAFWSHLGGFLAGLILAAIFRAPQEQHLVQAHGVLEAMNDRGPVAIAHAADKVLKSNPGDLVALHSKADAHEAMHEIELEIETRLAILDCGPELEAPAELRRLIALGALSRIEIRRRAKLAEFWRTEEPEMAIAMFKSIVDQPDDEPQRPDAMLSLAILLQERDPGAAERLLQELGDKYSYHGAATVARARGLIS